MRVYTVHSTRLAHDEPILVKEGFCWPAFLFGALWALWHRLWLTALALFVIETGLGAVLTALAVNDLTQLAAMVGLSTIIGFFANDWRRLVLDRRGLRFEGVVAATDADAALRRWCDLNPLAQG